MVQKYSNVIIYIVSGEFQINNLRTLAGESLLISTQDANQLNITSKGVGSIVICSGVPHNEPIYQHGSYVD